MNRKLKYRAVIAAFSVLFLILSGCTIPLFFPDLSYAAKFSSSLTHESRFAISEVYPDNNDTIPLITQQFSHAVNTNLLLFTSKDKQTANIFQIDLDNTALNLLSDNPATIKYSINGLNDQLGLGFGPPVSEWEVAGIALGHYDDHLRFTDIHPVSRADSGDGVMLLRDSSQVSTWPWEIRVMNRLGYAGDLNQPFRPSTSTILWTFLEEAISDPFTKFDGSYPSEGFVLPSNGGDYELLGLDSDDPSSSYFSYLFIYSNTGSIYEAVGEYSYDCTVADAITSSVDAEYLVTRVTFPDGTLNSVNGAPPKYTRGSGIISLREGALQRTYFTAVELDKADYVAFGWDSGTNQSPNIKDSQAKLIADKKGTIYGQLIAVLHDGTLIFKDIYDGSWTLYREGDDKRKKFNPGNIRFLREYKDVNDGQYYVSLTALSYGDSGLNDGSSTLYSDNYIESSSAFLKLLGY